MSVFLERQKVRKRRAIAKGFKTAERILLSVAIVLGGLAMLYGIYLLVFLGPIFSVGEIIVEGNLEHLTTPKVVLESGVKDGETLFGIDVEKVHANLRQDPWISQAAVRRRLPHTLWIYIEESKPVAVMQKQGKLFLVDHDGIAFKEMEPSDPKTYPVITGIEGEDEEKNALKLKEALSLLKMYNDSSFGESWGISELHIDDVRGSSVVTEKGPVEILLGQDANAQRLGLLGKWQGVIGRKGGRITYIIANEDKRIIVGYKETISDQRT